MDNSVLKNIISAYNMSNRNLDTSEEMIYAVKRKGFNDEFSNLIVAASLKNHQKKNVKENPKIHSQIVIGVLMTLVGFGISYWSLSSGKMAFIFLLAVGIVGVSTLFKGLYNIVEWRNNKQEKEFIKALLTEVRFDKRLSSNGEFLAIKKLQIPIEIIEFVTSNFNDFDKTVKLYTANYISLEFAKETNLICIDKKLEIGVHKEITKRVNDKFNTTYLFHDLTIPYMRNWVIETQQDLDKKDLF